MDKNIEDTYIKLLKIDTNTRNENEELLKWALKSGNKEIVRILIENAVDVNIADDDGRTPLHKASCRKHVDIIKLLISHGAEVNAKDDYRKTPLHLASSYGLTEVVQILISHGADVNAKDEYRKTPLHLATGNENTEVVQILISHGADINAKADGDETPLYRASYWGHTEVVKVLIEHGADINIEIDDKDLFSYFITKRYMFMLTPILYYFPKSYITNGSHDICKKFVVYSHQNAINKMKILQIEGVGYEILEFVSEVLLPHDDIKIRRNIIENNI